MVQRPGWERGVSAFCGGWDWVETGSPFLVTDGTSPDGRQTSTLNIWNNEWGYERESSFLVTGGIADWTSTGIDTQHKHRQASLQALALRTVSQPPSLSTSQVQHQHPKSNINIPSPTSTSQVQHQHPKSNINIPSPTSTSQVQHQHPKSNINIPSPTSTSQVQHQHPKSNINIPSPTSTSQVQHQHPKSNINILLHPSYPSTFFNPL
ncbi:uncharacterized protein N7446_000415 [Penicillium canescens]|uniref:Uncharacterized protein n=1 Tax=Penicillium canescens TaxID=5083 RepID=A0AAD6N535_PENCN|nr:uncharacterized protein N7446_000415 [Penicillium canescens]KAJ6030521.1 hypothetical protein N7460_010787 [Penicillium canescens]KAJ6059764.1 hypothetical protein N7444_003403 [Penicillium canescens]KAJ6077479.1 hypothetical protein N7446_000415 [Penicillium canescens]